MEKVMNLTYSSSLTNFCELNPSFDAGKLRIAYHGKNRNGSRISKKSFEKAAPTMFNCPIVCRYDREEDKIGSHDIKVVKTGEDSYKLVNLTTPVGVVPESATWYWETVEEPDGTVHEYMTTQILLWKRQEAYEKLRKDGIEAQSMEIEVLDGWTDKEDGSYVIDDFVFTAFCLLGEDTEPCFESAGVEMYASDIMQFKQKMTEMMADLKNTYSMINSPNPEVEINNDLTEGGENLDEKLALVSEYGYSVDDLEFALDDLTVEELREKFEAMKASDAHEEAQGQGAEAAAEESFALESDLREGLCEAVHALGTFESPWGTEPSYWFVDYDRDASEVYAEAAEDWKLYGFTYAMNGDNVVIDADSKKRMKWAVVPFDNGEENDPFAGMFAHVAELYTANDNAWSEKFQNASDTISTMNEELTTLRGFKKSTEEKELKEARDGLFEKFAELDGNEAFEALKNNAEQYDLETIEEKCYAIKGRENSKRSFAAEKQPKIKVTDSAPSREPYGGIFVEYGIAD